MGRPKQLLPLNGKPAIRHCLDCIASSGVTDIVVVLGANGDEAASAIAGLPVRTVFNSDPRSEMAESARLGLANVDGASSGVLVCLADHPLVSPDTVRKLVRAHSKEPDVIIIPLYNGRKGHPALFPPSLIREVFSGLNLRDVIARHAGRVRHLDVQDEGVILDMDTPEDYERIRRLAADRW